MAKRLVASVTRVSEYLDKFLQFQQSMIDMLKTHDHVIGLMFAGSSADTSRADQYSDQDFFLVVENGQGELFRQDLSWLPNHDQIVIAPRETEHGLKVVYENGDLLEFAVFEDADLDQSWLAVGTDFKVAFENKNISARLEAAAKRALPKPFDRAKEFELFLSLVLIGVGRFRRGEKIAADQHIKSYALAHALRLIRDANPIENPMLDTLNPYRRFEFEYPKFGAEIFALLQLPGEDAAKKLTSVVLSAINPSQQEASQFEVISRRLGWN
jgi:hypothetical protein